MSSDPILGEIFDGPPVDINRAIRELMDVARVALQPQMGQVPKEEAKAALAALLTLVERSMPDHLQDQDRRVIVARQPGGFSRLTKRAELIEQHRATKALLEPAANRPLEMTRLLRITS